MFLRFILFCFSLFFAFSVDGDTLSLTGSPSALSISTATAGQQPDSVTNNSTSYSITTLTVARTIVGSINANMPAGVTLKVALAAPSGATSQGSITMTTTNNTLVSNVKKTTIAVGLTVTYLLSATVAAAQVSGGSRTLTLTVQ